MNHGERSCSRFFNLMCNPDFTMTPKLQEHTDWRAIWQLLKPYWVSDEKWIGRGLLAAVVGLALFMVYLDVLFNTWNRDFYNALEHKDSASYSGLLLKWSYIAFTYIAVAIYRVYLTQSLEMRWRTWMTKQYLGKWLARQSYYRIEQTRTADNPDQRIAEDLRLLTSGSLSLSLGLLSSVVSLVSFVGILWAISGPVSFMLGHSEITIPGYMVWFAIGYAGFGSALTWWTGKPLVTQSFNQQRYEADFRFGLVRIREYAEAVALYRGEDQERARLEERFQWVRKNWWDIMRTTKRLNLVSTFYGQFALIFPFLVGAPRYFAGKIELGELMQISSAFGHVQDSLSWFVNAFSTLADWKASVNRLAGFHAAVESAHALESGITVERNNVGALLLDRVELQTPQRQVLTKPWSASIHGGQRIVVTGPSGCGKSTLFRAMAGIWPYGAGNVEVPNDARLLFVPQRSYLPIGTLRAAIAYPAPENAFKDLAMRHYLQECKLGHLRDSLDHVDNWSQRLSPGEQQRLAFVRVLLTRPEVLFLDEATSALDTSTEELMYALLLRELPDAAVISVAHRDAVAQHHQECWQFVHEVDDESASSAESTHTRFTIQASKIAKAVPAREVPAS
jgi:putative ATP-binding cassette transporter